MSEEKLSPQQVAGRIRLILEANPSLLDEGTSARLMELLGGLPTVDGQCVPVRIEKIKEAPRSLMAAGNSAVRWSWTAAGSRGVRGTRWESCGPPAGLDTAARRRPDASHSLMRAVQITRFGGPEVLDVVDVPEPEAGPGQTLHDVSTALVNYADTHHWLS
jgi:hypothetical protein